MKIYKIPSDLRAFIFDIDSTLYTNQAYAFEQVDCQVRQFAKERGITADEARRMVADYRKKFAAEHKGSKVSLGNTLLAFDVGAGKTFIMIAAAMIMRQKGISRKNMFVVPNNIVGQWAKIFTELYPNRFPSSIGK